MFGCRYVCRAVLSLALVCSAAAVANAQAARFVELMKSGKVPASNYGTVVELICTKGEPDDLRYVYEQTLDPKAFTPEVRLKALTALAEAAQTRKVKPSGDLNGVVKLLGEKNAPEVGKLAIRLASVWELEGAAASLKQTALDPKATAAARVAALEGLVAVGGKAGRETIEQLAAGGDSALRFRAIAALAGLDLKAAATQATAALKSATPDDDFAPLLDPFLTRKGGPEALAAALEKQPPSKDISKLVLRTLFIAGNSDPHLNDVLSKAADIPADPPPPTPEEVKAYVAEVAAKGDPVRGEAVFRRADVGCFKCHALVNAGGQVGPDLTVYLKDNPVDYIVTSILEPTAAIKEQFHTKNIITGSGQVFTGIVVAREEKQVKLKDATGKEILIPTDDIEEEKDGKSLMPNGVTKFLTRAELVDLVRFVSELGKPGPFGPRETPSIQRWRVLRSPPTELFEESPNVEKVREFLQNVKPEECGAAYARVCGVLPLAELADKKAPAKHHFLQGEVNVKAEGDVTIRVKGPAGIIAWLEGSPLDVAKDATVPLAAGIKTLTLRVPAATKADDGLIVEVLPARDSKARLEVVGGA